MFNLVGILAALMIAALGRGNGMIVGWESLAAVGIGAVAVFAFYYSVSSHLVDRWQLLKLRSAALPSEAPLDARRSIAIDQEMIQRRLPLFRVGVDVLILTLFGAQSVIFGWPDYVTHVLHVPEYLDLAPDLLPYFAMLVLSWVGQYRIERKVRGSDWRPLKFLAFQLRANVMTVLPIVLIYAVYWAILQFVPHAQDLRKSFYYLEVAVMLGLVVFITFFVPLAIRMVLPASPLPDGRLRRRLESFAKDRGLKVNQILVWRTGSRMFATAFVIGLASPFRYVFITDSLMRRLSEDEILAVYAHELGHVRHRHLWWLLAFIISLSLVMMGAEQGLKLLPMARDVSWISFVGPLAFAYFLFGYISRRFERQADAFAAKHTSPELLAQVFVKLGMANPAMMKKQGWRHFSLEQRIRELMMNKAHPEVSVLFSKELWRGMALGVLVTIGALILLVQPVREDIVSGLATYSLTEYDRARVSNARPEHLNELRQRTLDRSEAMGNLNDDYQEVAYWYEGIVQGLAGEQPEALDKMLARAQDRQKHADTEAERRAWASEIEQIEATRIAIDRARENGTSFFEEYDAELVHRGLKSPEPE
ncbi:MAG: M48 family metalloprotease [Planctomycetes bacterium]|nr:M48 family metalloprotease [Planctomycetota bacterium]